MSGKTTFGLSFKSGISEYERVIKLTNKRNITIAGGLVLVFIANLIYDINRFLHLEDRVYAETVLMYIPFAIAVPSLIIIPITSY